MNGHILSGTNIAVDYWKIQGRRDNLVHFLTHLHGDHIAGLTSSWQKPIYCSELTSRLLTDRHGLPSSLLRICALKQSLLVSGHGSTSFTVTAFDASHCPGAVMFYFQGDFGNILYTGDFRASSQLMDSCRHLVSHIDTLYLDNTFCSPKCAFPSRDECLSMIVSVIQQHPLHDVLIGVRKLGKESLLAKLGVSLNETICVSPACYQILHMLFTTDVFTTTSLGNTTSRIRTVPMHTISRKFVEKLNAMRKTIAIIPSAIYTGLDCQPFCRDADVFVIPYSDHSSYVELGEFVSMLRPTRVLPIVQQLRGPFGVDISDRTDMTCFQGMLQDRPEKHFDRYSLCDSRLLSFKLASETTEELDTQKIFLRERCEEGNMPPKHNMPSSRSHCQLEQISRLCTKSVLKSARGKKRSARGVVYINCLTDDNVSGYSDIIHTTQQYSHLTGSDITSHPTQHSHLTDSDITLHPTQQYSHLTDSDITSYPTQQHSHLTGSDITSHPTQHSHLTDSDITLHPTQHSHLTDSDITSYPTQHTHLTGSDILHPTQQYSHLTDSDITSYPTQQHSHLTGSDITSHPTQHSHLTDSDITLHPTQHSHLTDSDITSHPTQHSHLTDSDITSYPTQHSHLTGSDILHPTQHSHLTGSDILHPTQQYSHLTDSDITSYPTQQHSHLTGSDITSHPTQHSHLTDSDITSHPTQHSHLTDSDITSYPTQHSHLTDSDILHPTQHSHLTGSDITSHPTQHSHLTDSDITLHPTQHSHLTDSDITSYPTQHTHLTGSDILHPTQHSHLTGSDITSHPTQHSHLTGSDITSHPTQHTHLTGSDITSHPTQHSHLTDSDIISHPTQHSHLTDSDIISHPTQQYSHLTGSDITSHPTQHSHLTDSDIISHPTQHTHLTGSDIISHPTQHSHLTGSDIISHPSNLRSDSTDSPNSHKTHLMECQVENRNCDAMCLLSHGGSGQSCEIAHKQFHLTNKLSAAHLPHQDSLISPKQINGLGTSLLENMFTEQYANVSESVGSTVSSFKQHIDVDGIISSHQSDSINGDLVKRYILLEKVSDVDNGSNHSCVLSKTLADVDNDMINHAVISGQCIDIMLSSSDTVRVHHGKGLNMVGTNQVAKYPLVSQVKHEGLNTSFTPNPPLVNTANRGAVSTNSTCKQLCVSSGILRQKCKIFDESKSSENSSVSDFIVSLKQFLSKTS